MTTASAEHTTQGAAHTIGAKASPALDSSGCCLQHTAACKRCRQQLPAGASQAGGQAARHRQRTLRCMHCATLLQARLPHDTKCCTGQQHNSPCPRAAVAAHSSHPLKHCPLASSAGAACAACTTTAAAACHWPSPPACLHAPGSCGRRCAAHAAHARLTMPSGGAVRCSQSIACLHARSLSPCHTMRAQAAVPRRGRQVWRPHMPPGHTTRPCMHVPAQPPTGCQACCTTRTASADCAAPHAQTRRG
jgi:hypothetical protein